MSIFVSHHVALSVIDLDSSIDFYSRIGFRLALEWRSDADGLRIAHLKSSDGGIVELFAYETNAATPRLNLESGNDLGILGVKHFGVKVTDLHATHVELVSAGFEVTPISRGRTQIDYFFVADPSGIWVEVVHDTRELDPNEPILIDQSPS